MTNGTTAPDRPERPNRALLALLAALALAAVAVGFYFIGKSAADDKAAEKRGVQKGRAEYAKGTPGYVAIFELGRTAGERTGLQQGTKTGAEQGQKVGFRQGQRAGQLQGQRTGIQSGANAALGGINDWQPGSFYIVKLGKGTNGVPFTIDSSKQMSSSERYAVCANNPADVCSQPTAGG